MKQMIFKKENAQEFEKHGVTMRVYNTKDQCPEASVVYTIARRTTKYNFAATCCKIEESQV